MLRAQSFDAIGALPASYVPVFEEASKESFFLSSHWFKNFSENANDQEHSIRIYGVEEGRSNATPVGALLMRHKQRSEGPFSPLIMEGLANYYSSYFGPALVSHRCRLDEVCRAFASALWADRSLWDVLTLQPLDNTSAVFSSLVRELRATGMIVQTFFCFGNWYLEVAGRNYREYFETLPSVLKKTVQRKGSKLEKSADARIEILTGLDGLEKALDDYETIYRASWKIPEPYPQFIRGLARMAAAQGELRFGLVYLNDEPAAAQLWFVHKGEALIFKLAYDERFAKTSAGTILTTRLMQHVIDVDRVKVVDYLTGDDDYKKLWMSHRRERWGITAFNSRSAKGLALAARNVWGRALKARFSHLFRETS